MRNIEKKIYNKNTETNKQKKNSEKKLKNGYELCSKLKLIFVVVVFVKQEYL